MFYDVGVFFKTKNCIFLFNFLPFCFGSLFLPCLFVFHVFTIETRLPHSHMNHSLEYEEQNLRKDFRISAFLSFCVFFSVFALWWVSFLNKVIMKSTSLCGLVIHFSIQELVFLPAENESRLWVLSLSVVLFSLFFTFFCVLFFSSVGYVRFCCMHWCFPS